LLNNNAKILLRPILIISIVTLLVSGLQYQNLLFKLEGQSYDWRMSETRADSKAHEDIAVILIDDASLDAMDNYAGRWPWPRYVYADLLAFMSYAEPKGVLFDITFTEKHRVESSQNETINPDDQELVDASASSPFAYHAMRFVVEELAEDESSQVKLNRKLPDNFINRFSLQSRPLNDKNEKREVKNLQSPNNNHYYVPFPELLETTHGLGVVEVQADGDSVYRRARLFHQYQDNHYASLSTSALIDNRQIKSIKRSKQSVFFDEQQIPVDENEKILINYYKNFNVYSFSGIIASLQNIQNGNLENLLIDPAEFNNKYVFIGGSAAGLDDLKNTSIDARLPGVFIHASIASNILANDFLTPPNSAVTYMFIFLFALITTLSVLFVRPALIKNGLPVLIGALFIYFTYQQFQNHHVIEVITPLLSLISAWILSFTAMVLMEGREKRRFKRMMSQYLSPAVLSTVVDNHEEFAKAEVGSKENITILFSDIRSFTNISEQLDAERVVDMLNHYFSSMTDAIFEQQGTIDKFIGDAIMAFWGAPIKTENHAEKATLAALDMVERLKVVNQWLAEKNLQAINIGIGIHTGDAILGNIGSENKLDYTIIGDNVNLASRIEGLTKQYGVTILITEETYKQLVTPIPCLTVDQVRVKGKNKPIKILHPLLLPDRVDEQTLQQSIELAAASDQAFQHYLDQEWDNALQLLDHLPDDTLHNIMRQRCIDYQKSPPEKNWDGVFTMTSK